MNVLDHATTRTILVLQVLAACLVVTGTAFCAGSQRAAGAGHRTIYVSVVGSDDGTGAKARPLRTIQAALEEAQPGDTIRVAAGDYREYLVTVRSGTRTAPITIVGSRGAIISGDGTKRLIQIGNDYITLRGFVVANADKLVWIQHAHGVRLEHNRLLDAGGECIRIKYLSTNVLVANNVIGPCGLTGFDVAENKKNGEGVYIGTDPGQLDRNPTQVPDASDANRIVGNTISTHAAECVDIKEAAERNQVIGNRCSSSRDPKGSGFDARGNDNLFRGNVSRDNAGAGIRFGGYGPADGIGNSAIRNVLVDNRGWGFLVLRRPQARLCGNVVRRNGLGIASAAGLRVSRKCRR